MKMLTGFEFRARRLPTGINLTVFGVLADVGLPCLSKFEHGVEKLSPRTWAKIEGCLTNIEQVIARFPGAALDVNNLQWMRSQFALNKNQSRPRTRARDAAPAGRQASAAGG